MPFTRGFRYEGLLHFAVVTEVASPPLRGPSFGDSPEAINVPVPFTRWTILEPEGFSLRRSRCNCCYFESRTFEGLISAGAPVPSAFCSDYSSVFRPARLKDGMSLIANIFIISLKVKNKFLFWCHILLMPEWIFNVIGHFSGELSWRPGRGGGALAAHGRTDTRCIQVQ